MAKVGYARVSTTEQNLDRQTHALSELGVEKVFLEKVSGVSRDRPELSKLLDYIRDGDVLVVESISRLARSTRDLLTIVETLREKGVELVSLKESIDTTTPQGRFVLSIFAALSELERETLLQRQREGIDAAKRAGRHMGRPRRDYPVQWETTYDQWKAGQLRAVDAMRKLRLPKATFYRLVKRSERDVDRK